VTIRVSPPKVFPVATAAAKPPADAAGSADSYRQTSFVLSAEVEAVLEGLNAEGRAAVASSGAKYRNQRVASAMGLWSRAWLARLEALHAVQWGNYAAATPLVRAAADHQAAMLALLSTDAAEWQEWLESDGIAISAEHHATEFRLHAFRSGETLAVHPILGPLYRVATDFSLPHFGATLLAAGSGSAPDHIEMTFGDRDFHYGLAELHLGWLLELGVAQANAVAKYEGVFAPTPELSTVAERAGAIISLPSRCRVEQFESDGERRYLVHNWRREPRSAAKRLLL
jgi:hypothetical protein